MFSFTRHASYMAFDNKFKVVDADAHKASLFFYIGFCHGKAYFLSRF